MRRTSVLATAVLGLGALTVLPGLTTPAAAAGPRCAGERATLVGTSGDDVLRGTPGRDVVAALGGADRVEGLGGRDILCGGRGRDVLLGGPGADLLRGEGGRNRVEGGAGADRIVSGPTTAGPFAFTSDRVVGGPGDDRVVVRHGADVTVAYPDATGPVRAHLGRGRATGPGVGRDRLVGVGTLYGSPYDDRLTGSDGADVLDGRVGDDVLRGGGGSDFLLALRGTDTVEGEAGSDLALVGAGDRFLGGTGDDIGAVLGGPSRAATALLGRGEDFLVAARGLVEAAGGPGTDTVGLTYGPEPGSAGAGSARGAVDLSADTAMFTSPRERMRASVPGFEDAYGSQGDDELVGDGTRNVLDGGGGSDTLRGLGGDDYLTGARGADTLDGGDGDDVCLDGGATTVRVDCEQPPGRAARAADSPLPNRWVATLAAYGVRVPR